MWLKHHVSENLILNQGCSQKYNYNENIHVDNNKIRTLEIVTLCHKRAPMSGNSKHSKTSDLCDNVCVFLCVVDGRTLLFSFICQLINHHTYI